MNTARNEVTALRIQDRSIEWASLTSGKQGWELVDSGREEIAPADADAGTATAASDPVVARLKALSGRFKTPLVIGVASSKVLLRVIDLPTVDDQELAGMVPLQVDKFSPFPLESQVVAHEILRKKDARSTVLIAAVKQDVVEETGRLLRAADMEPSSADADVLGRWRVLSGAGKTEGSERRVLVILEESAPEIVVAEGGQPVLFRALEGVQGLSGEELAGEIAREVAHALMSLELELGASDACVVNIWSNESPEALRPVVAAMEQACACPVSVHSLRGMPSVAEGLARRKAENTVTMDLTPASWRTAQEKHAFRRRMLVAAAAIAGVWAFAVLGFAGTFFYQAQRVKRLESERTRWLGPATEVREMRARVVTIRRYMDRTRSALECLREVSSVQPDGVDLTSFTYRKNESVKIAGEAAASSLVYSFKSRLDSSPLFRGTVLHGPSPDPRTRKEMFDIEIKLPKGAE